MEQWRSSVLGEGEKTSTHRLFVEIGLGNETLFDHRCQLISFGLIQRFSAEFDVDTIDFEKPNRRNHRADVEEKTGRKPRSRDHRRGRIDGVLLTIWALSLKVNDIYVNGSNRASFSYLFA